MRGIHQNVCQKFLGSGIPEMLYILTSKAEGNITSHGFKGTEGLFSRSNEITVMLHFTRENTWNTDQKFSEKRDTSDPRNVISYVARATKSQS